MRSESITQEATVMPMAMRSREDLEHQHAAVLAELGHQGASEQSVVALSGVADALSWVLGRADIAPITLAAVAWPTPGEVMAEHGVAEAILYGRRDDGGRPREWVSGVEQALLWAAGGTPAPPVAEPTQLHVASAVRDEMADLRQRLAAGHFSAAERERIEGALAALGWVAGEITTAPLSKRVRDQTPEVEAVEDESDLADDLRYGGGELPEVSWDFVAGVDQALRWVQRRSDRSAL